MSRPRSSTGGVYLAGPSGFFEAGVLWHNTVVIPKVIAAGLIPKDPWSGSSEITEIKQTMDYGSKRQAALRRANLAQGRADLALIDESQAILASLDGQDVDSGTALEIGYGFAKGLLIVGVRTDLRMVADNEGGTVNLMIETCIADSGGLLTTSLDDAIACLVERLSTR